MKQQAFLITLTSDVIVSEHNGSTGSQPCLDVIPQSSLRGLLAHQAYRALDKITADQLIFNGQLQLSDASIFADGEWGLPVPLCFHHIKGEEYLDAQQRLIQDACFDPALCNKEGQQPKQLRNGFITPSGRVLSVKKNHHTKTAIERSSGSAADSQLFQYQSIASGQQFVFVLHQHVASDEHFNLACQWLSGKQRIGRSRSAEFGQVTIAPIDLPTLPPCQTQDGSYWLLADMPLRNEFGQASFTPSAAAFGCDADAQWLVQKSYLRTRKRSQYNSFFRCYLPEEAVLKAGSLVRFASTQNTSQGWIWLNGVPLLAACNWFSDNTPQFSAPLTTATMPTEVTAATAANSTLIRYLQDKLAFNTQRPERINLAQDLAQQYRNALRMAIGYYGGVPPQYPSTSQLGNLRSLANQGGDVVNLWLEQALSSNKDKQDSSNPAHWREGWQMMITPQQCIGQWLYQRLQDLNTQYPQGVNDIVETMAARLHQIDWSELVKGEVA